MLQSTQVTKMNRMKSVHFFRMYKKTRYLWACTCVSDNIWLLNNKFHGLSPYGGHHSLLFDQGFQKMAGWD